MLLEVLDSSLVVIRMHIQASASIVEGAGYRHTAEHICIYVILASPVLYCEGELLDHEHPASWLADEIWRREQPFKRLVISNEGEVNPVQVVPETAHRPHSGRQLAVVTAVIGLMLVEALRDTGDNVLKASARIDLSQYSTHAMIAPIGVEQGGGVTVVGAEHPPLLTEQALELVKDSLVVGSPSPGRAEFGECVEVVRNDAVIREEAAIIIAEP
jgi:hypothetical protein